MKYLPILPALFAGVAVAIAVQAYKRYGPDEFFYFTLVIFANFVLATFVLWSTNRIVAAINDLKPKPKPKRENKNAR